MPEVSVSVVMPVHNGEGYLRDCLDSVIGQTLRDIEIILVDDGSTDRSLAILDAYAAKDSRITVLHQECSGAAPARNKGISIASGRYLSILDSDDIFEPKMLERMLNRAEKTEAQIVICRCDGFEDGTGKPIPMAWSVIDEYVPQKSVFSREELGDALFFFCQGWAWDKLYLTSFVREQKLEFQDLRSSNDLLFTFLSLAVAKRITLASGVFVHQRRGRDSSISRTRERRCDCFYHALLGLHGELFKRGIQEETQKAFLNLCVHLSMWHFNTLSSHRDSFFFLYDKLQNEYFPALGIGEQPVDYFLPRIRPVYEQCLRIISTPVNEYLYDCWRSGSDSGQSGGGGEELERIKSSVSYRAGRALTWLPRTVVKGARFAKSCGIGYTLRLGMKSLFGKKR